MVQGEVAVYYVMYVLILFVGTNYFGSHFFLGNCKFNSPSPEVFLFGENNDLNYLGSHPVTVTTTTLYQSRACIRVHLLIVSLQAR